MKLKKLVAKYKRYESKELARRVEKKKQLKAYKSLNKKNILKKRPKLRFSGKALTKTIGNPYGVKYPKAKKALKNIKRNRPRKRKVVVFYR